MRELSLVNLGSSYASLRDSRPDGIECVALEEWKRRAMNQATGIDLHTRFG